METISDDERIEKGQLLARTIIEILGAPKEHVEKALKDYIDNLKKDTKMYIVKEYFAESEEHKDKKMFSTYVELEIWFKDPEKLISFCFDSLPSSIEIIEPQEFKFQSSRFNGLINDLQAKLHQLDASLKKYITDHKAGSDKFKKIVENFMFYAIKSGKNKPEDIAKIIGIEKDNAEKLLNQLADRKVITKKGDSYHA